MGFVVVLNLFFTTVGLAQTESDEDMRPGDQFVTVTPVYQGVYTPPIYNFQGTQKETGIRLGRAKLHGVLGISNAYDSNVFFTDTDPSSDYVMKVVPGADLVLNTSRFYLQTGYRFTFRNNLENDVQDNQEHRANLDTSYRLSRAFIVSLRDHYEKTSDPAGIDLLERIGRWTNNMETGVKYITPGEDLEVGIYYTNTYQQYDSNPNLLNYLNNKVSVISKF